MQFLIFNQRICLVTSGLSDSVSPVDIDPADVVYPYLQFSIYTRNVNIFNIIVEDYFYPNYIIRNTVWVSDEKKICIKASLENVRVAQMLIIYTTILNNS